MYTLVAISLVHMYLTLIYQIDLPLIFIFVAYISYVVKTAKSAQHRFRVAR
jgi:hypothetical protein